MGFEMVVGGCSLIKNFEENIDTAKKINLSKDAPWGTC